jgi:hypothetical protein
MRVLAAARNRTWAYRASLARQDTLCLTRTRAHRPSRGAAHDRLSSCAGTPCLTRTRARRARLEGEFDVPVSEARHNGRDRNIGTTCLTALPRRTQPVSASRNRSPPTPHDERELTRHTPPSARHRPHHQDEHRAHVIATGPLDGHTRNVGTTCVQGTGPRRCARRARIERWHDVREMDALHTMNTGTAPGAANG